MRMPIRTWTKNSLVLAKNWPYLATASMTFLKCLAKAPKQIARKPRAVCGQLSPNAMQSKVKSISYNDRSTGRLPR